MKTLRIIVLSAAIVSAAAPSQAAYIPGSASANVTPNSASVVSSLLLATGTSKVFIDASATIGATSMWLMIFDAITAQTGAVTYKANGGTLVKCVGPVANGTVAIDASSAPINGFATGILIETSTTGCLTATLGTSLIMDGRVQ